VPEVKIGVVSHYFNQIQVAAIDLTDGDLNQGDTIHVLGKTSDFTQKVDSMQIEHEPVDRAVKGDSVGVKMAEPVRVHDEVYKVVEE